MGTSTFLFVGGHPALDFLNTEMIVHGVRMDLLANPDALLGWLAASEWVSPTQLRGLRADWLGTSAGQQVLQEVKAFRAGLRRGIERTLSHHQVPPATLSAINRALSRLSIEERVVQVGRSIERQRTFVLRAGHDVVAYAADQAADFLVSADLHRIKQCANPACILFFYDTTKNGARRWCSMDLCGNRIKAAVHYRRHR